MPIWMLVETVVVKIAVEQSELPEMQRDVLADIGDRAGGTHDNFGFGFFRRLLSLFSSGSGVRSALRSLLRGSRLVGRQLHHPTPRILARSSQLHRATALQQLKRRIPELQMEDVALLRQQIEIDAQSVQGVQVEVVDSRGDDFAHLRRVAVPLFNFLQYLPA
jgi:hypothetical protein